LPAAVEARLKPAFGLELESQRQGLGAAARIGILLAVFFLEKTLLNEFVDFDRAQAAHGFGAFVRVAQHWVFRFLVAAAAALALFVYVQGGETLRRVDAAVRSSSVRFGWAFAHGACVACLVPLSYFLYRHEAAPAPFQVIVSLWIVFAAAAVLSAAAAMAPRSVWRQAAASLGVLWVYALLAGLVSACAIDLSQRLWEPTATLTFKLVRALLLPVLPQLAADPVARTLSTPRFAVEVSSLCSGLEGVGLILAFSAAWLVYFRREYIFPRALLLIPAGLAAIFALNVVRIAVLVLIGNAGYPDVAIYGFHSQAGWIAFIAVACGLVLVSRRSAWLYRAPVGSEVLVAEENPTAAYLMPLLAILTAGIIAHAISGSFEYFYPLRVIAGLTVLGFFWKTLGAVEWRFSWRGPAVGAAVFVAWILAARYLQQPSAMPERLAAMSPLLRVGWILTRTLGSVAIVPIAEELAYRGYLMRRLSAPAFEAVPYASVKWTALLASSLAFGLAHGDMWFAGTVAGAAYGLLVVRTGHLSEAIAAHVTSNALVAAAVLVAGDWQLW